MMSTLDVVGELGFTRLIFGSDSAAPALDFRSILIIGQ